MKKLENYSGHIGVPVNNLAMTVKFYRGIGFEIVSEAKLQPKNEDPIDVAFMGHNELLVEFYEVDRHEGSLKTGPINHIAVQVKDLQETTSYLESQKIPLIKGPTTIPFGSKGMTYIMIEGPNNERIEFDQFY